MIFAGIDAGSRMIKVALVDSERHELIATACRDQGVEQARLAEEVLQDALAAASIDHDCIKGVIATGYGRSALEWADAAITEITCHAVGVKHLEPDVRTVIDIGGQDSKLIRLESNGTVYDFVMNDRCAAGTGRFLEVISERLELNLEQLGEIAAKAEHPAVISSMCVVFAESEIIGLLASGQSRETIVAGVQESIAKRMAAMAGRKIDEPIVFTGGVALIPGMQEALQAALNRPIRTARQALLTGALGAALLAARRHSS